MKRLIIGLTSALVLAFVGTARADDTKSTESKSTTQKSEATKEATPSTHEGMGGSGTATKAEKKSTTKEKEAKPDAEKTPPPAK